MLNVQCLVPTAVSIFEGDFMNMFLHVTYVYEYMIVGIGCVQIQGLKRFVILNLNILHLCFA